MSCCQPEPPYFTGKSFGWLIRVFPDRIELNSSVLPASVIRAATIGATNPAVVRLHLTNHSVMPLPMELNQAKQFISAIHRMIPDRYTLSRDDDVPAAVTRFADRFSM